MRPCSLEPLIRRSDPQVFIGGGLTAYHAPKFPTAREKAGAQDKPQRLHMSGISSSSPQGTLGLFPKSSFQPRAGLSCPLSVDSISGPLCEHSALHRGCQRGSSPGNGLFIVPPSLGEATVSCAQNQ